MKTKPKTVRMEFTVGSSIARLIDQSAKAAGMSRSAWLARIVTERYFNDGAEVDALVPTE